MIKINKLQLAWAFITDSDCENYWFSTLKFLNISSLEEKKVD